MRSSGPESRSGRIPAAVGILESESDESEIQSVLPAEIEWLRELAPAAGKLIGWGKRLAQEHIGWEFLHEQDHSSK